MNHIDVWSGRRSAGIRAVSAPEPRLLDAGRDDALVHVVDVDDEAQQLLTQWLTAAGIRSRTYAHLGAFLNAHRADVPGCLVIDAQPPAISGLEPQAILLLLAIGCPIVVTAYNAEMRTAGRELTTGAIDFVDKPLREREVVTAICAAIEVDRRQRAIASRRAVLRSLFATLSPRERQVMKLVTAGLLNKQIGADLGLSEITVKAHRGAAMRKMGARSLADLVRMADTVGDDVPVARNGRSTPTRNAVAVGRHSGCTLGP
jgi:FixJ family two-component response regulator